MESAASSQVTVRSLRAAARRGNLTVPITVAVVAAIASGTAAATGADRTDILLPLIAAAGLGLAWLALTRFTYFVAAILLIRASLDAVKISDTSTSLVDPAALVSAVFIVAGGIWLLVQPREERAPRSPLVLPLTALALVAALSTFSSTSVSTGLVDSVKMMTVALMLAVLNQVFRSERDVKIVIGAAFTSATIPLLVAAAARFTGTGYHYSDGFARVTSTFSHPNPFAMYLCMLIIMGAAFLRYLSSRAQIVLIWFMAACGVALLVTYTRSAWIAAVLGVVIVAWLVSRRVAVAVVVVGVMVALLVPDIRARFGDLATTTTQSGAAGNSLVWRFEYWRQAVELNGDLLLGSGLSTVRETGSEGKAPHNDFIRIYVEVGLLGLAAYLWFLIAAIRVARDGVRDTRDGYMRGVAIGFVALITVFVVLSVVSNVITQLALLWYFGAFAAAAVAAPRLAPNDERVPA